MIDKCLLGHPPFRCHQVMVGSEVCDVYFRDVVACIRALIRDLDFAPYLVFAPDTAGIGLYALGENVEYIENKFIMFSSF